MLHILIGSLYSLGKCLFKFSIFSDFFVFLLYEFLIHYSGYMWIWIYIWIYGYMNCKYFLLVYELSFHFLGGARLGTMFSVLMKSNLYIFSLISLIAYAFSVISKKTLPNPRSQIFKTMFSSKNFIALALRFRFQIHFELMFLSMVCSTDANSYF